MLLTGLIKFLENQQKQPKSNYPIVEYRVPEHYRSAFTDIFGTDTVHFNFRDKKQRDIYKRFSTLLTHFLRHYIVSSFRERGQLTTKDLIDEFNLSRQMINYHTQILRKLSIIEVSGHKAFTIQKFSCLECGRNYFLSETEQTCICPYCDEFCENKGFLVQDVNVYQLTKEFDFFIVKTNLYGFFLDQHRVSVLIYNFYLTVFDGVPEIKSKTSNGIKDLRANLQRLLDERRRLRLQVSELSVFISRMGYSPSKILEGTEMKKNVGEKS